MFESKNCILYMTNIQLTGVVCKMSSDNFSSDNFSILLVLLSIYLIIGAMAQVFIDDHIHPSSIFMYLLISTFLTSAITSWVTNF